MNGFRCDVCFKQRREIAYVSRIAICRGCAVRVVRRFEKLRLKKEPPKP